MNDVKIFAALAAVLVTIAAACIVLAWAVSTLLPDGPPRPPQTCQGSGVKRIIKTNDFNYIIVCNSGKTIERGY